MVDPKVHTELFKQLERLSLPQQRRVLEFARCISPSAPFVGGIPGSELIKFAGAITPEDCEAIMAAIEAGCEQVDPDEW